MLKKKNSNAQYNLGNKIRAAHIALEISLNLRTHF